MHTLLSLGAMARLAPALLLLLLAVAALASTSAAGGSHLDLDLGSFLSTSRGRRRKCRGTVAECLAEEEEGLDLTGSAESHRRALYGRGYISYGALQRDNVPCKSCKFAPARECNTGSLRARGRGAAAPISRDGKSSPRADKCACEASV